MILVIDTSTAELLVAIASDAGEVLRESRQTAATGERGIHDARLASETARLLGELQLPASAIARIGLVIGPGSFTGLRIGLSFAKGFALATNAAIVTLTQHETLAAEVATDFDRIVTPGYRPGLFYAAHARTPRDIELLTDLSSLTGPVLAHASLIDRLAETLHASFAEITSDALARLTSQNASDYRSEQIDVLEPLYLGSSKF